MSLILNVLVISKAVVILDQAKLFLKIGNGVKIKSLMPLSLEIVNVAASEPPTTLDHIEI